MLLKFFLTSALISVDCFQFHFWGSIEKHSTLMPDDIIRGYSTSPDRFEFFGKNSRFEHVLERIKDPISGNGTNVVLIYNNVAVTLFDIPINRTLEVITEDLFKSLPHKVIKLKNSIPKVINLDF